MVRKLIVAVAVCGLMAASRVFRADHHARAGRLIGAGLGAGTGAIIGSTVGHAAVGALIGGPVGLIAGALIGDHLMGQERRQQDQTIQSDQNEGEIERLRRENQRLREERIEK